MLRKFIAKDGKEITIRTFSKNDIKRAKEFADYFNSIIRERDFIVLNKPVSVRQEREILKDWLEKQRKKGGIHFIAEHNGKIAGIADVKKRMGVMNHIAAIFISVRKEYRGIGIGSALMEECIKAAKRMKAKILRLEVYSTNKRAITLYKKYGFKKVAEIPHQIQRRGKLVGEVVMLKYL